MSNFTTLHDDQYPERDHDIDADLGGLDEEIRRHRAISADVTRGAAERETAQTTARTIAHCVYLLRGKTLVGVGIGVIIWLRRFRRTATIVAATAGFSSAAAIGGAAIITPSTPHYTAATPAATAPVHHRPVTHHAAGTPTGRATAAGGNGIDAAGPAVAGAPSTVQHEPRATHRPSVKHTRAATKATTVGIPPPTVVHNQRPTTAPTPTSAPTQPDPTTTPTTQPTQPTQPTAPTSSGPTSLLHLKLPLPVKLNVTGLLGLN